MRISCFVSTAVKAAVIAFVTGLIVGLTVAATVATATPPVTVDKPAVELRDRTDEHVDAAPATISAGSTDGGTGRFGR